MGDYTIQSLLGRGGMARVYLGYDENLERYAAVKVIDSQLLAGDDSDEYYQRFQREARSIARLRHANIVGIYQFGQADSDYYMAMVYIDGQDLRQVLKQYNRENKLLETSRVLSIMRTMAAALDYAHANGVIHRDVKPSNILVTKNDDAVLTDFGLVLNVPEGTIGNTFGSAHYIAPEQAVNSAHSVPQSDLYSLAVCLYEMLTGRVPFDDSSAMSVALKHLSDLPPPPSQFNTNISPVVESVLLRGLEKEPEDRYETGAEFMAALEAAFEQQARDAVSAGVGFSSWNDDISRHSLKALAERTAAKISQPRPALEPHQRLRSWPWWVVLLAIISLLGLGVWQGVGSGATQSASPSPSAAAVAADVTATQATSADNPTEAGGSGGPATTPSETSTDAPTETPTTTSSPTDAPTATATPTPTDTQTPMASPTSTEDPTEQVAVGLTETAESLPTVQLRYNDRTLVLYNDSGQTADVSGLTFVRTRTSGAEDVFRSNAWTRGATAPPAALPRDDCFQLWTTTFRLLPVESYCDSRHAWRSVAPVNAFWRGEGTFEVQRDGETIATCEATERRCEVPIAP